MTELLGPGEMSARSGLSSKALRLYQSNGLLAAAEVDPVTGYRSYTADQVARGQTIGLLRRLEMPLAVIAEVLDGPSTDRTWRIARWWEEQEQDRARAQQVVDRLAESGDTHQPWSAEVTERTQPETLVATITRKVDQSDLLPTFTADVLAIRAHLHDSGLRPTRQFWVIYYEFVATDGVGRIETCVPYDPAEAPVIPAGPIGLRVEPARRLRRTSVTAGQCRYPTIIGAFDAVMGDWREGDTDLIGPPREIYAGDFSDDPDVVVAEVAVPIRE